MKLKIVVLSLDSATERRAEFATNVPDDAPPWTFFDAHRSLDPRLHYDEAQAKRQKGRPLRAGELGCYSSHFAIWQRLLDSDDDAYVVLEDDIVADWPFLAALADYSLDQAGIHYLRLYYKKPCPFVVRQKNFVRRSTRLIELLGDAFGTQGYYIDKAAARRFSDTCATVVRPIDDQLDRHWDHGIPNLSVFPFPLFERTVPSEIGDQRFDEERAQRHLHDGIRKRLAIARRRRISWPER